MPPPALGWMGRWRPRIQRERNKLSSPASAFLLSQKSKTENFLFLFEKNRARAKFKKCRENFSVLGRKLLQSLRAEDGAERKPKTFFKSFLGKKVRTL